MSINKNGEIWRRSIGMWGFPSGSEGKNLPAMWKMRARSLGQEDPLEKGMATHISILAWQIPRTSWVWYCIIILQIVPIEGNCSGVHRISLYYFLYPYVNLQLTQKKKFNLKIFTSSIFTDNILLNVVLKGHILISIFSLWMRIYKWRILTNLPSYALNLLPFYTVNLQVQHQGDEFSTPYELTFL